MTNRHRAKLAAKHAFGFAYNFTAVQNVRIWKLKQSDMVK